MKVIWSNGQWIDEADWSLSPSDRGLLHGYGLFETVLAVDGVPVFAERHLKRLGESANRLGWSLPQGLLSAMRELLNRNQLGSGRAKIRLAVTGGSGPLSQAAQGDDFCAWMSASAMDSRRAGGPVRVVLSPWRRNEHSALVGLKCASYAENLVALQHAKAQGYDEALFLNTAGMLCEAATANVFLVKDGELWTPALSSGCLPGVTRELVIEMAKRIGLPSFEKEVSADALNHADEVFLTSSLSGVVGVDELSGMPLGAHGVTDQLRDAWRSAISAAAGA